MASPMLVLIFCLCVFLAKNVCGQEVNVDFIPDQAEKDAIVEAHNAYRRAQGSSNMQEMIWNELLARAAAITVDGCVLSHSEPVEENTPTPYGQNIYQMGPEQYFKGVRATDAWYSEYNFYDYDTQSCVEGTCWHYTQIVWHDSFEIGCAQKYCSTQGITLLACNYYNAGNYRGVKPFLVGDSCSDCPQETPLCNNGLCATCNIDCRNGIIDDETCSCECNVGYMGKKCDVADGTCMEKADLVFIMDNSYSVNEEEWVLMKEFLKSISRMMNVKSDGSHVAIIDFAGNAGVQKYFVDGSSADEVFASIDAVPKRGTTTRIDRALDLVPQVLSEDNGDRLDVEDIVLLVTDGKSSKPDLTTASQLALKSEFPEIDIFALGIGRANTEELTQIATDDNTFHAAQFVNLEDFVDSIRDAMCSKLEQANRKRSFRRRRFDRRRGESRRGESRRGFEMVL